MDRNERIQQIELHASESSGPTTPRSTHGAGARKKKRYQREATPGSLTNQQHDGQNRPVLVQVYDHDRGGAPNSERGSHTELRQESVEPNEPNGTSQTVLLVALYLKQKGNRNESAPSEPDIFLDRTEDDQPETEDEQDGIVPKHPSSWLDHIRLGIPVRVVECRIDAREELDRVARHIRDYMESKAQVSSERTSTVFFTHGYGILVLHKILCLDEPWQYTKSVAAVITFASPLASPDAARVVQNWTRDDLLEHNLGAHFKAPEISPDPMGDIMAESDVMVKEYWDWSLSNEPFDVNATRRANIATIAEIHDIRTTSFRKLRQMIQKALSRHRVLMVSRSRNLNIIDTILNESHNITATTSRGQNILHLAILEKNSELFNILVKYPLLSRHFIKQPDRQGNTALHIAINLLREAGGDDLNVGMMVKTLFDSGASRTIRNSNGETPLSMAAQFDTIKDILFKPQWIGRRRVPVLVRGKPRNEEASEACEKTYITVTRIRSVNEKVAVEPEEIRTVKELLYQDRRPSELLLPLPLPPVTPNQWYHIPLNNVSRYRESIETQTLAYFYVTDGLGKCTCTDFPNCSIGIY